MGLGANRFFLVNYYREGIQKDSYMIFTDERMTLLRTWLDQLPTSLNLDVKSLEIASSDASFRRYLRVKANDLTRQVSSFIVMDAPPSHEDCKPFIGIAKAMHQKAIPVPEIIAENLEHGFLLLSDFGNTTFLSQVQGDEKQEQDAWKSTPLYHSAIRTLIDIQTSVSSKNPIWPLPAYDRAVLHRELMLYPEWYVKKLKGIELSKLDENILKAGFEKIIANNLMQPFVAVHRDYHSRNLMVLPNNLNSTPIKLGVIDFQDALDGPITYDLVSLLRDAYIEWQESEVMDWAIKYWELARKAGLPVADQFGDFYRDFEWMGIQRHIKVLGIFARLAIRDGKSKYLDDIPLVLRYTLSAMQRYGALKPMAELFLRIEGTSTKVGYTF